MFKKQKQKIKFFLYTIKRAKNYKKENKIYPDCIEEIIAWEETNLEGTIKIERCEICGKKKKLIDYIQITKELKKETHHLCKKCFYEVLHLRTIKKLLENEVN